MIKFIKPNQLHNLISGVVESSVNGIMALKVIKTNKVITGFECILFNPRSLEILDATAESLKKVPLDKDFPLLQKFFFDIYLEVIKSGMPSQTEQFYHKNGKEIWLRLGVAKLGDSGVVLNFDLISKHE